MKSALEIAKGIVDWKVENPEECTINIHNVTDLKILAEAVVKLTEENEVLKLDNDALNTCAILEQISKQSQELTKLKAEGWDKYGEKLHKQELALKEADDIIGDFMDDHEREEINHPSLIESASNWKDKYGGKG